MGGYGRGVKEGSKRGPYAKTEDRRKAKEVRESVKAADDAGKRRLEEAAEEAKAAAKRRRQEDGVALVSDGLRDRGHTAPETAAAFCAAAAQDPAHTMKKWYGLHSFFVSKSHE